MKLIDLDSLPAQDWLMLRLDELNPPYRAILNGDVTVDQLEAYCGAIRFALFEFGAHTGRCPGRFTETARTLITATEQVLKTAVAAASGSHERNPKWQLVTKSISRHGQQLEQRLRESLMAEKKRKRQTDRIALAWATAGI